MAAFIDDAMNIFPCQYQEPQKEDGKAKLKISGCIHHIKMPWGSMEKQLNSSGKISQDFRPCLFFEKSRKDLEEQNIQPENFEDQIIFMSMTLIG